jgi:hypothetical protein
MAERARVVEDRAMKNAEKYVPEPVLSSCLVMPKNAAKGIFAAAVAQNVSPAMRVTSDMVTEHSGKDGAPLDSGTAALGLLAVTSDEVVLVNGRRGMLKPVATGLGGRGSRRDLVRADLGSGKLVAPLRLAWADGTEWELDVPRGEAKRARALLEELHAAS